MAHLNHGLRGDEADADAGVARRRCASDWACRWKLAKADVSSIAAEQGDGGKRPRGRPATTSCSKRPNGWAHGLSRPPTRPMTRSETVLHRILRGTGLAGLAGIPRARPLSPSVALVRPLLAVKRREVLDYLGGDWPGLSHRRDERGLRAGRAIGCGTNCCRCCASDSTRTWTVRSCGLPCRPVKRNSVCEFGRGIASDCVADRIRRRRMANRIGATRADRLPRILPANRRSSSAKFARLRGGTRAGRSSRWDSTSGSS